MPKKKQKKRAIPEKLRLEECEKSPKAIISKVSFGRRQRRKPTEVSEQGGVQKVERHIKNGKCRQGTHTGPKHARWPETTAETRLPWSSRRAFPENIRTRLCVFMASMWDGIIPVSLDCTLTSPNAVWHPCASRLQGLRFQTLGLILFTLVELRA